jgi:hypothetical protein
MTDPTLKARAEAVFHLPAPETEPDPLAEYLARQDAGRAKTAMLRELRLAAEAKTAIGSKAKRKPGGKAKR